MRKLLLTILLLTLCVPSFAESVERYEDYSTGKSVTADNLNGNFNNIVNVLNSGLDNNNADTDDGFRFIEIVSSLPAAGNQGRVVFLTSTDTLYFDTGSAMIAVGVLTNNQTFTGNNTFTGTTTLNVTTLSAKLTAGTDEIEGSAFDINGGSVDGSLTWTAAQDFDSKALTNVNIDSGTIDGVNVDGATLTGMLYVNDSSDDFKQLASQGTTGQFLQSAGAGADPVFAGGMRVQIYTSGNNTWTVPTGVTEAYITACAGGGGGGGCTDGADGGGGGGGAGQCLEEQVFAVSGTLTANVGAGGAGGVGANTGATGGTTTVGSQALTGGNGGKNEAAGGTGGVATSDQAGTGDVGGAAGGGVNRILWGGAAGGDGSSTASQTGGGGGSSRLGLGGTGGASAADGDDAPIGGGGGGGSGDVAGGADKDGGAGGSGFIVIRY